MNNNNNNIQLNNEYININNIPNNNNNNNELSIIGSTNFSEKEIEKFKNIINKTISKYVEYKDIAKHIRSECETLYKGYWSVIVGLRDNVNISRAVTKSLAVNIKKYKIIIDFNPF
jgi:hypothetical protein